MVWQPGELTSLRDFAETARGIREIVGAHHPALVVSVELLEANIGWWLRVSAIVTGLGTGLSVLALVLAAVGIYGLVSYAVSARYREIGIRMALGATARDVLGLVLRQTLRPVVIGAVIGLAAAAAVSRILSSVLFGVSPSDPVGLGGATLFMLGVALTAATTAARRVTRADPTATLRYQ